MSDSRKHIKPASVAAFLFMPQLRLSSQHLSFIVPVFIRTIALMFEQSGLLPPNHPATKYGIEGIKKYGFFELIGEAWYNLRANSASPYQWGLFAAVVMMVVFIILSAVTTLLSISGMLVGTASAQIFDHPTGNPTDSASIAGAGYTGIGAGSFDKSFATTGAHMDYGIMILDKILRQGAEGTGGTLQNAFGSLMQIYNTGVLVVAGIMLFWAVLAVVVDTAKTGQVGGGRHNMVWAPMRIVFALGLLIPLGTNGFSSGQFMVMKLAEWGSNFGTRGWTQYVTSVASGSNLIAAYGSANPTSIVSQYTQMWICRVAYNGYAQQAGALSADQIVMQVPFAGMPDDGKQMFSFTNTTGGNLCGTVTYPTANDPALIAGLASSDVVAKGIADYKVAMINAYTALLTGGGGTPGSLGAKASDFACDFVAQHIYPASGGPDPLFQAGCSGAPACGAIFPAPGVTGQYPTTTCITDMITSFNNAVNAAETAALGTLTGVTTSAAFFDDITDRGWPGMGMWYHRIEQMNSAVASMQVPQITITAGDPSNGSLGSAHADKVNEILAQYQKWWLDEAKKPGAALGAPTSAAGSLSSTNSGNNIQVPTSMTAGKDLVASVTQSTGSGIMNSFADLLDSGSKGAFVFDLLDPADANTYPLAQLAKIGDGLQKWSLGIYGLIGIIEMGAAGLANSIAAKSAGGFWFNFGSAVSALVTGPLTSVFTTMAGAMFMASLVLKYYIPILPFIRVVHAVLTWMISVFEAVVMVPIAALAHLTTEGEGLAGGARGAWILWLNVLLRPMLTVIGFVAAMLIFNTFVIYLHNSFATTMLSGFSKDGAPGFFGRSMYTLIYVFIVYTAANSIFKLLDLIPSAMMRWMGGSADQSFDQDHSGALGSVGSIIQGVGQGFGRGRGWGTAQGARNTGPSLTSGP